MSPLDVLPPELRLTWDAYLEHGSVKRAAVALSLHPRTVVRHLAAIRMILNVASNVQAADRLAREAA